ncbi:MAG: hypothetical protein IPM83_08565 [Ignavibacteria bacterium]|nr:hypothetical protein [Ignavibacteria bacterium]
MASDDEPMKVSIQRYQTSTVSWQGIVLVIGLSIAYALIASSVKVWLELDRHSPDTSVLIIVVSSSSYWLSRGVISWKKAFIAGTIFLCYALAGFALAQFLYTLLRGVEPLILNRFLIYLPISVLALVVVPMLALRFIQSLPTQRPTLSPIVLMVLVIAFTLMIAGAEWLQVLTG